MNVFRGVSALILLAFAVIQYNDPDPEVWITIYGIGALLCLLNIKKMYRNVRAISLIFILAGFVFSIYNWPSEWLGFDQTDPPNINVEKARESCGLLIASLLVGLGMRLK